MYRKVFCQSSAVLRAIGRMGKLMPTSDDDLYQLDKLVADAEDSRSAAYKALPLFGATKDVQSGFIEVCERACERGGVWTPARTQHTP